MLQIGGGSSGKVVELDKQVIRVMAASPPHMNGSVMFARGHIVHPI